MSVLAIPEVPGIFSHEVIDNFVTRYISSAVVLSATSKLPVYRILSLAGPVAQPYFRVGARPMHRYMSPHCVPNFLFLVVFNAYPCTIASSCDRNYPAMPLQFLLEYFQCWHGDRIEVVIRHTSPPVHTIPVCLLPYILLPKKRIQNFSPDTR
jgi:hypothetical protein